MLGIYRKADIANSVDNGKTGIVAAKNFIVDKLKPGRFFGCPMYSVVTRCKTDVDSVGIPLVILKIVIAVIVSESHYVFAVKLGYTRVENERCLVGYIGRGENRFFIFFDNGG